MRARKAYYESKEGVAMRARKFLVLLLAVAMIFSVAACNNQGTTTGTTQDGGTTTASGETEDNATDVVSAPGEFPIVEEKITLKFFSPQNANIKDLATNEFTTFYEEKTNVHIEWETVPSQALSEKRNLILASGDYPDVFFGAGITREDEMLYGPQGLFVPMNDLIDRYGLEIKKMFDGVSYIKNGITTPDGNIYTLPQVNECYHCMFAQKMWINQKWMTELGLDMPTTTDEFYEVLKAFKEEDPNGNGLADEIPLSGSVPTSGWHSSIGGFLMNAFIYYDNGDRLRLIDDKVDVIVDKPEYREGLRYLNMLYNEGLIDPAAFTQDADTLKQVVERPDVELVGAVQAGWFGVFTSLEGERHANFEPVPPIKGPAGVQLTANYPYTFGTGQFAISSTNPYPEASMRWADWLYSPEATLLYVEAGREGIEWRAGTDGELDFHGRPAKYVRLGETEYGEIQNVHYYQMGPSWRSKEYRESWVAPEDPYSSKGYEIRLHEATYLYDDGYAPEQVFPPLYMAAEQVTELTQIKTPLIDFFRESMARFITGDLSIEDDWDKYLSDLESLGIQKYVDLNQTAYDASAYVD